MPSMPNKYAVLGGLAMLAAPAGAAIYFYWQMHTTTLALTGQPAVAVAGGLAVAITVELVGILAGHVTTHLHRQKDPRWVLAGLALLAYVAAGLVELWGTPGAVAFIMSPLVYLLVALRDASQAEAEQQQAIQAEQQAIQLQQAEAEAERQHQLELAKLDANKAVRLERVRLKASTQPAPASTGASSAQQDASTSQQPASSAQHLCQQCQRTFGSVQALNAHQRFCSGTVLASANGHGHK